MLLASVPRGENSSSSSTPRDKYTRVPNAFLRYWARALKSEYFFLVWIVQATLGWQGKDGTGRRDRTAPTSFAVIAKETGYARHAMERAAVLLERLGLVERTGGQGARPVFSINSQMLADPPLLIEQLVPIVDKLREELRSPKSTKPVPKEDRFCRNAGQVPGAKEDKSPAAYRNKENRNTTTNKTLEADAVGPRHSMTPPAPEYFPWAVALATANQFFPGTGQRLMKKLASEVQRVRPETTDKELAEMLQHTHSKRQQSAGLWLYTVPDYATNYLRTGNGFAPTKPRGRTGDEIE
jgi:hypothetical protein